MLRRNDVYGIVVTYNPDSSIIENINILMEQVSYVLVVDNGSNKESLQYLKDIQTNNGVEIITNKSNMGVAYALNQGLCKANNKNFKLILTMDQDSKLSPNCIDKMIEVLNENKLLVSVGPNYNSKNFKTEKKYYKVDTLITSGNLTYTDSAVSTGGYNSDLFIDSVDFDFSLALKKNGGELAVVCGAKMSHMLGDAIEKKILTRTIKLNIHSPIRHYYMFRNHYFIIKKYICFFPKFCIKKELIMWKYFVEVILLYPDKMDNVRMILKGVRHASQKRYGKYLY